LFLLPAVKEAMQTALELDPSFAPAYALGGTIYYEVPGFAGGDLDRSEALFRKGLEIDPHYTNMRLGLARTLLKKGRGADAKRETTGPAAARLIALADTPEAMRRLSAKRIERAIFPVGFYRTKARVLLGVCRDLLERFGGLVPDDIDRLLTLKGVGRKTANLV